MCGCEFSPEWRIACMHTAAPDVSPTVRSVSPVSYVADSDALRARSAEVVMRVNCEYSVGSRVASYAYRQTCFSLFVRSLDARLEFITFD